MCLFAIFIFFLLLSNILCSDSLDMYEHTIFHKDNLLLNILLLGLWCGIMYLMKKKKVRVPAHIQKKIWNVSFVLYGILLVLFVFHAEMAPIADQYWVQEAGRQMSCGEFTLFEKNQYMAYYPNQYGLAYLWYCIFKLTTKAQEFFYLLNVAAILAIVYVGNEIGNVMFGNDKGEKQYVYGWTFMLFFPLFEYVTFLYNIMIGMAFCMLGILFLLKYIKRGRKFRDILLSCVFLGLSVLIKQNYIIAVVGCILILLYDLLKQHSKKTAAFLIGIVVCVVGFSSLLNYRVEKITNIPVSKGIPSIAWATMGIQEGFIYTGWYNGYNLNTYLANDGDVEQTKEIATKDFKERMEYLVKNPAYTVNFFKEKLLSQWNNPTFQCIWINNLSGRTENGIAIKETYIKPVEGILQEPGDEGMFRYMDLYQGIILLGCFLWILQSRKVIDFTQLVFAIIFVGGFLFHIIWEAKCQYGLPYFMMLFPYAVVGYKNMDQTFREGGMVKTLYGKLRGDKKPTENPKAEEEDKNLETEQS